MLMSWVVIGMKRGDERAQAWRENDQIAGAGRGIEGVRGACGNKDGCARARGFRPVGIAKQ